MVILQKQIAHTPQMPRASGWCDTSNLKTKPEPRYLVLVLDSDSERAGWCP
jgi:hypothetical protein